MNMINAIEFPSPDQDEKLDHQFGKFAESIHDQLSEFQDSAYYRGCEVGKEQADSKLREQRDALLKVCREARTYIISDQMIEDPTLLETDFPMLSSYLGNLIRTIDSAIGDEP